MGMGTDNRPRAMSSGYHIFRQRGIPGACSPGRNHSKAKAAYYQLGNISSGQKVVVQV